MILIYIIIHSNDQKRVGPLFVMTEQKIIQRLNLFYITQ